MISSWDIGGARPKAVVRDQDGTEWIVKFPKAGDTYNRERVEHANLDMAEDIGIHVPARKLQLLFDGRSALLVKRSVMRGYTGRGLSLR